MDRSQICFLKIKMRILNMMYEYVYSLKNNSLTKEPMIFRYCLCNNNKLRQVGYLSIRI